MSVSGNTVELFDEPAGHLRRSPRKSGLPDLRNMCPELGHSPSSVGRGSFGRWRRCSSLMIGEITSLLAPSQRPKSLASRPRRN